MLAANIIVIVLLSLIVFFLIKNKEVALILSLIGYMCVPLIKISPNQGFNAAYFITFIWVIAFVVEFFKKKIQVNKIQIVFFVGMQISAVLLLIASIINSKISMATITNLIGFEHSIVAIFVMSSFLLQSGVRKKHVLFKTIFYIVLINCIFSVVQMMDFSWGVSLVEQLYVDSGNCIPLQVTIEELGKFVRIFGANYSPTVIGIIMLISFSFLLGIDVIENNWKNKLILSISLGLGLLAFSKSMILGSKIDFLLIILCVLICKPCKSKKAVKRIAVLLGVTGVTYMVVIGIQIILGLGAFVNYYHVEANSIVKALNSRYGNMIDEGEKIENNQDKHEIGDLPERQEEDGNQKLAIDIFKNHPIIGVGPAPIEGEFLGDSEIILILHNGGILNMIIYAVVFLYLFFVRARQKKIEQLMIFFSVGMACLSLPALSANYIVPFLAYCIGDSGSAQEVQE